MIKSELGKKEKIYAFVGAVALANCPKNSLKKIRGGPYFSFQYGLECCFLSPPKVALKPPYEASLTSL